MQLDIYHAGRSRGSGRAYLLPFGLPVLLFVGVLVAHVIQNAAGSEEYGRWVTLNQGEVMPAVAVAIDPRTKERETVDLRTGEQITTTWYSIAKDGRLVRVTPDDMITINAPLAWRLFEGGIRCGDAATWFTDHVLDSPARLGFRPDPTNPTPFSVVVVFGVVALIWSWRLQHASRPTA